MKKLIAMLLLASLMMSIAVSACADGTIDRATAEKDDFPKIGVTLYYPDDFKVEKGLYTAAADDDMLGPGIYFVQCNYIGVSMEWYESALHTEDIKQEDIQKYMNSTMALLMLIGIDQNRNAEDICAAYKALTGADVLSPDDMTEVGRFEDITWYLLDKDFTGNYQNLEPEYASEYDSLHALAGTIASNADYYRPVGTYDTIADQTVSFETTDLDGNPVTSKDIFSKYDVTMINVWATWCSACLSELSELEEINSRLAEKNCAIVAILGDGDEEEAVALGKKQLEEVVKIEGKVAVIDLRPLETIYAGNRFMVYAMWPEIEISVHVAWGFKKQNTAVMIGKSIINKASDVDIGELCFCYGGGGHANAGTCQLDNDVVDGELPKIIAQLNGEPAV